MRAPIHVWAKAVVVFAAALAPSGRPAAAQDLGLHWESLPPEKAAIVFQAPELDTNIVRYLRSVDPNHSYVVEVAMWTGIPALHPKAIIHYIKLQPGYHFRSEQDPEDILKDLPVFQEKDLHLGDRTRRGNALGRVRARRFSFGDVNCVAFAQIFGQSLHEFQSAGTNRVSGYYCGDPGTALPDATVTAVLTGIGIKGVATP